MSIRKSFRQVFDVLSSYNDHITIFPDLYLNIYIFQIYPGKSSMIDCGVWNRTADIDLSRIENECIVAGRKPSIRQLSRFRKRDKKHKLTA